MPPAAGAGVQPQDGRMTLGIASHGEARTLKRRTTAFLRVWNRAILKRAYYVLTARRSADDLPVIRENFKKGFLETQTKVNSWFGNLKKQLNGEDEEEEQAHSSQRYEQQTSAFGRPRRSGEMGRRSGDRERYDADPQVLSDDFSALELRDGEGE